MYSLKWKWELNRHVANNSWNVFSLSLINQWKTYVWFIYIKMSSYIFFCMNFVKCTFYNMHIFFFVKDLFFTNQPLTNNFHVYDYKNIFFVSIVLFGFCDKILQKLMQTKPPILNWVLLFLFFFFCTSFAFPLKNRIKQTCYIILTIIYWI